jgi:putative selenate reductase
MSGFSTITVCTDLLKPGGYGRLHQYFQELATIFSNYQVKTIKDLILKSATSYGVKESASENLMNYAIKTLNDPAYKRNDSFGNRIKGTKPLEKYDCISAPCTDASPLRADVSGICHYTTKNNPEKAFSAVLANNPLPAITGMAGPEKHHRHCTRLNYEQPVLMNELNRFISEFEPSDVVLKPLAEKNKLEVAVIGGGPSGLSCAWFLNRLGFQVDVFEAEEQVGGMIAQTAPEFRLTNEALQRDIQRIKNSGIKILANSPINKERYENIRENYDYIFISTGASQPDFFDFQKDEIEGIVDGVEFLKQIKKSKELTPGRHYAILGSNYIAADAARTAKRICGNEGSVTLITPEAFEKMTVDQTILNTIEDEDIEIFDSAWVLEVLKNETGATGLKLAETEPAMKNNKIVPGYTLREETQQTFSFDTIISCPERKAGNGFFNMKNIKKSTYTKATNVKNVYAGGGFTNTAGTLESAIGDGKMAALEIAAAAGIKIPADTFIIPKSIPLNEIQLKRFHREKPLKSEVLPPAERMNFEPVFKTIKPVKAIREANRCLHCDVICNVCVNVCPNKAIIPFEINPADLNVPTVIENDDKPYVSFESKLPIHQKHQVLVVADWCNNCGNCTSFCPKAGSPNLDKIRVHLNKKSFAAETSGILLSKTEDHSMMTLKRDGNIFTITELWDAVIFENDDCNVIMEKKSLKIEQIDIFTNTDKKMVLPDLAEMKILFKAVKHLF